MLIQKLVFIAQSGASVVLYILLALSVLSIGVIIERWWYFKKRRFDLQGMGESVEKHLRKGDLAATHGVLKNSKSVESEIVRDALGWYEDGPESVQEILQKGIRQRRKGFEGGLLFLGTLGNNAPFVGLFGTVLGVVAAFRELGNAQTAMASGGGGMGNVMSGIAEALVATGVGILVALPAVVAYNVFQKKGSDIEENTGAIGNIIVAAMKSARRPSSSARLRSGDDPAIERASVQEENEARRLTELEA